MNEKKIHAIGGSYPLPVMLSDIATISHELEAAIFIGLDSVTQDARIWYSSKNVMELSHLKLLLDAYFIRLAGMME